MPPIPKPDRFRRALSPPGLRRFHLHHPRRTGSFSDGKWLLGLWALQAEASDGAFWIIGASRRRPKPYGMAAPKAAVAEETYPDASRRIFEIHGAKPLFALRGMEVLPFRVLRVRWLAGLLHVVEPAQIPLAFIIARISVSASFLKVVPPLAYRCCSCAASLAARAALALPATAAASLSFQLIGLLNLCQPEAFGLLDDFLLSASEKANSPSRMPLVALAICDDGIEQI